jgi:hypothetical protein
VGDKVVCCIPEVIGRLSICSSKLSFQNIGSRVGGKTQKVNRTTGSHTRHYYILARIRVKGQIKGQLMLMLMV